MTTDSPRGYLSELMEETVSRRAITSAALFESFVRAVVVAAALKHLGRSELAKRAGLTEDRVQQLLSSDAEPTVDELVGLADAVNLVPEVQFRVR